MAVLDIMGFDDQNSIADLMAITATPAAPFQWSTATTAGPLVPGRFGGKAFDLGLGFLGGTLSSGLATGLIGSAVRIPGGGSFSGGLSIGFWDSVTQRTPITGGNLNFADVQMSVEFVGASGHIFVWSGPPGIGLGNRGASTLLYDSGANAFPVNSWMYLGLKPTIGAGSGALDIELNGNTIASLSGLNTRYGQTVPMGSGLSAAPASFDSLAWGFNFPHGNTLLDDVYIADTTGPGPFNALMGQVRVFTRFPNGAGAATDFMSRSGGPNYVEVQERAMDGDTSYNYDANSIVGHKDLFTADPLPAGAVPLACKVKLAARQDSSGGRALETLVKSGAVTATGASVTLFQEYTYQADVLPLNPSGNVAWTKASVDASQIGYELTA